MKLEARRAAALVVASALGIAACGVSTEGTPRTIAADDVPFSLLDPELTTSTTLPPAVETQDFQFFLIRTLDEGGSELVPVVREVPRNATIEQIIRVLFDLDRNADDPAEADLITRLDENLQLLEASLSSSQGLLTLDFADALAPVTGEGQAGLFAQIVCTMTQIDSVDRVQFEIDGESEPALTSGGEPESDPVSCRDYASFFPPDPAATTTTTAPAPTSTSIVDG